MQTINVPGLGNFQLIPASALSASTQNQLGLTTAVPAAPSAPPSLIQSLPPGVQILSGRLNKFYLTNSFWYYIVGFF